MIYIHIPFCKQKCSYCNFHFSTSLTLKNEMLLALKKELFLRRHELKNKRISSLYFGGGTPSILSVDEIKGLIEEVLCYCSFDEGIEITLEANPDDLEAEFLRELSSSLVNRLSIGIQSFHREDLELMKRAHTSQESEKVVKIAQDKGFENISIDLIYGTPTSSFEIWQQSLEKVIVLGVPHISSYALTVESKTELSYRVRKGKISKPDEFIQSEKFYYMVDFLQKNDFEHYEISNFGKSGFLSKHNSAYWEYKPYLGIGPSAHSYDGKRERSWNVSNNKQYIKYLSQNILPKEIELLSDKERFNEILMLGLRTSAGVNLSMIENDLPLYFLQNLQKNIKVKIDEGILTLDRNYLKINKKHWFMADGIASDLFVL